MGVQDLQEFFVKELIKWHRLHRRAFPWRENRDAYRVLVAELMLQRTRADQVAEVFNVFVNRFPDVAKAASANVNDLKSLLHNLGLHHRIPRFIELFKRIMEDYRGVIPPDLKELMKLPGIGRYTASAVLCFGYSKQVPVVDANVVRVLSRFFGIRPTKKRPHNDPIFWNFADELIKFGDAVQFNEAILDFASLVCSRKPRCDSCPVKIKCDFFNSSSRNSNLTTCQGYSPLVLEPC